jgi:hypothetical protein
MSEERRGARRRGRADATQGFYTWVIRCKKTRSQPDDSATHRLRGRHTFGNVRAPEQHSHSRPLSRNWYQGTRCRCHVDDDGRSVAQKPVSPGLRVLLGDGVIMAQMQQKPPTGPTPKPATPSYKPATPSQPKTGGSPPMTGPSSPRPGQPGQPSQTPKK